MSDASVSTGHSDDVAKQTTRHATCVAAHGNGVLITGASGSGKSSLALALMAYGAQLVADDGVILQAIENRIMASAPAAIDGLIEARGIGILRANPVQDAPIKLVIDMNQIEQDRLPPFRYTMVKGQSVPLLYKVDTLHFPAAVMQYLTCGRQGE
jgi:HPr kinase/phosphorylase